MDFFQILVVASPGPYAQTFFFIFEKKFFLIFCEYFSFSLTWDPMAAKISKCYSYKSQPKVFKLFLNFLPNGPHKTMFGIFEILKIEILTNFIRFRYHGTQWERKFQNATPPTNCSQKFWNLSWIFLPMVLTKVGGGFLKFWVSDF